MFVDDDFPPDQGSLLGSGALGSSLSGSKASREGFSLAEEIQWLRPSDIRPAPTLIRGDKGVPSLASSIVQGRLEDCNVVATLAAIASNVHHDSLLRNILCSTAGNFEAGFVCCRFWLNGRWTEVKVDTFIPCFDGSPAFAHARDQSEVYMCLLEKAYAKALGGYANIQGRRPPEVLRDLTGAVVEEVHWASSAAQENLWKQLQHHLDVGDVLLTSRATKSKQVQISGPDGVVSNHTYVLLRATANSRGAIETRKIEVYNPWGKRTKSSSASHEEGSEADEGYGIFAFDEFLRLFNRLYIATTSSSRTATYREVRFDRCFSHRNAGGCLNFETFSENAMLRLPSPTEQTEVVISVSQIQSGVRDVGTRWKTPCSEVGFVLLKQYFMSDLTPTDLKCCSRNRWHVVHASTYRRQRELTERIILDPLPHNWEYRIVPTLWLPGDLGLGGLQLTVGGDPSKLDFESMDWIDSAFPDEEPREVACLHRLRGSWKSVAASNIWGDPWDVLPKYEVMTPKTPTTLTVRLRLLDDDRCCGEDAIIRPSTFRQLLEDSGDPSSRSEGPENPSSKLEILGNLRCQRLLDSFTKSFQVVDIDSDGLLNEKEFSLWWDRLRAAAGKADSEFLNFWELPLSWAGVSIGQLAALLPKIHSMLELPTNEDLAIALDAVSFCEDEGHGGEKPLADNNEDWDPFADPADVASTRGPPRHQPSKKVPFAIGVAALVGKTSNFEAKKSGENGVPDAEASLGHLAKGCSKAQAAAHETWVWSVTFSIEEERFYLVPFAAFQDGGLSDAGGLEFQLEVFTDASVRACT